MRLLALALVALMFTGCVGSPTAHTVMGQPGSADSLSEVRGEKLWWQHTTVGVSKADNPWEKFNQPKTLADPLDPWADFQEPELFPEDFTPRDESTKQISKDI